MESYSANNRSSGIALILTLAILMPGILSAQIEEIIVTAQKRSESLQDVGVAITAFTGDDLRGGNIVEPRDLFNRIPNVSLQSNSANGQIQLSIRGISFATFSPAGVQPVVMFQDEVAQSSPQTAGLFIFDLERIEVLRGPQNTLYGRNTTGGAVNFITRKPEIGGETNGYADITGGNFGTINFNGAVGGNLSEKSAYRLAVQSLNNDGYWDNLFIQGDRIGERNQNLFRAQLLWEPNDSASWLFNVHGGVSNGESRPVKAHGLTAPGLFGPPASHTCPDLDLDNFNSICEDGNGGVTNGDTDAAYSFLRDSIDDTEAWGGSVRLDWSFDNVDFLSLTAVEINEWDKFEDNTGLSSIPLITFRQKADTDQFTQEFRWTSNGDSGFRWIAGLYAQFDDVEFRTSLPITVLPVAFAIVPNGIFNQETTMYSAFGQIDFDLSDKLTFIAGLRFVTEKKEGTVIGQEADSFAALTSGALDLNNADDWLFENLAQFNAFPAVEEQFSETWNQWGGKLGLEFSADNGTLWYGHITRGEKGGQFSDAPDAIYNGIFLPPAEPEEVIAYEAGFKATFAGDTIQTNLAVFFNDYSNQQAQVTIDLGGGLLTSTFINAAESETYGLEAEVLFAPGSGWFIDLGLGLLRTEIVKDNARNLAIGIVSIEEGRNLTNAPETTINFGITKEFRVAAHHLLTASVNVNYSSSREFNLIDVAATRQFTTDPSYTVLNAHVAYRFGSDDQYNLSVWGKNLTDELYFNRFEDIGTSNLGYPGNPRTYGVTFGVDF